MYIDWVISLSLIIVVLTCAFLGYGVYYAIKKINQDVAAADDDTISKPIY